MRLPTKEAAAELDTFLPRFCDIRIVFSVIIIAELLAFVLTLATPSDEGDEWVRLSVTSIYIQWIALLSTTLLCWLRPWLGRLRDGYAGLLAFMVLMSVTAIMSTVTYKLSQDTGIVEINMQPLEFMLRNLGVCAITSMLALRYFYLQHQLKLNIEAENQARLQALQARIRPHFLFNTLNTIASLIRRQPKRAEEAVEDLADLFRHSLNNVESRFSFAQEQAIAQRYLDMEKLRLGDRLEVNWQVDEIPPDASLPALTLQPMLENAICHGLEPLPYGGTITIIGRRRGNTLSLTIGNPLPDPNQSTRKRQGLNIAVDITRQRLFAHFEEDGKLISQQSDDYYQVELRFPYQAHVEQ